jgi:adenylate kinase
MRIVFLGAPGAGKGTQAKLFCEKMGLAHISTGEMLRRAVEQGADIGRRVQSLIDVGLLVPDFLMVELIESRIKEPDAARGYVLDGFPRTVAQAEALAEMLEDSGSRLSHVVFFDLTDHEVLERLKHRREVESRPDDSEDTQQKRLDIYKEQTLPLVEYYAKENMLLRVDAKGTIEEVQELLCLAVSG